MDWRDVREEILVEMPVEESQAAMEARWYCWVTHRRWGHHHSLSLPTRQRWQLNSSEAGPSNTEALNYKAGPHPGCSFKCLMHRSTERTSAREVPLCAWHTNNREGPQAREPSKCLNGWSNGERLAKEAFWPPATRGSKKDCDRAITPVSEAVGVPEHLAPPGSPQAKQLDHLHAHLSLGQNCDRQKVLCLCAQDRFGRVRPFMAL